ncbi:MAG TPA: hypothetical protein VHW09_02040 [Bryobacteraceae bacterium]|jgi:MinD-like ATPase involved in chromosome partitioning or flagellar assembly/ABC-type transport system involved in cytochrome c biogenesis ATPase subunit|nr:hypothetical protein [Bryobacteraceae bacterium]
MTASQLLKQAQASYQVSTVFRFPYVHVIVADEGFAAQSEEQREWEFATKLKTTISEIRSTASNALFVIRLLSPEEISAEYGANPTERGHHWLGSLAAGAMSETSPANGLGENAKTVHFYGYKGGQARSTILALVASSLADEGWKVLAVDSDLEAPSLDIIFGRSVRPLAGTLLGVSQGTAGFSPERVHLSSNGQGFVDLLACRPRRSEYDIDAVAFALKSALDATIIQQSARRIRTESERNKYDIILIDHRAGLSPITLPWLKSLPGPVVISARLDDQWQPARTFLQAILKEYPSNPGLFVSWKPDEEDPTSFRDRNQGQIDSLLDLLADALSDTSDGEGELSSVELEDHWILLPYDSAFRASRLPEPRSLLVATNEAITRIRGLLEISGARSVELVLTPSGATDAGDLIQTAVLRELLVPENSIAYILGRKGTGKTRLLRELAKAGIGETLISDSNSTEGAGLASPSIELSDAASDLEKQPDHFWWSLFAAALQSESTSTGVLRDSFVRISKNFQMPMLLDAVQVANRSRTFLIDSLETAFPARLIQTYLESLFRVLQIIDTDPRISKVIKFKVFLRSDLAERGFQNIEQQLHGRTKHLSWNTQLIFNFVLSRIATIPWYRTAFPKLVADIQSVRGRVLKGELSIEECERMLLVPFPSQLRRNNLQTTTFLKTYFADSASDKTDLSGSDRLRYYPRIFDKFLEVLADPQATKVAYTGHQLDNNQKINQSLIFLAHEEAAKAYLSQLESELVYLISLAEDHSTNQAAINALLNAFAGLKTPFVLDDQIEAIRAKVPSIPNSAVRAAMESMKRVGMFEDRPDYPGQWRVGRLFKSSLRMKYVR